MDTLSEWTTTESLRKIYQPEGKRNRGRPRMTFEEHIQEVCKKRGKSVREVNKMANSKKEFTNWTLR